MSKQFKRDFGTEENRTVSPAPAAFCPECGKMGFAALRVMVTPPGGGVAFTVCFKKQCVFCSFIPGFAGRTRSGEKKVYPLFYMPYVTRPGGSVKYRDFYFPPQIYQTADGRADVALKARLAAAVVQLAFENPRRPVFSWEEVVKVCK